MEFLVEPNNNNNNNIFVFCSVKNQVPECDIGRTCNNNCNLNCSALCELKACGQGGRQIM